MAEDEENFDNIDALIERMEADDLADAPLITPVNYAKVRPIASQLVYYAIRTKKIKAKMCPCGRKCIDIQEADDYYRSIKGEDAWPFGKKAED